MEIQPHEPTAPIVRARAQRLSIDPHRGILHTLPFLIPSYHAAVVAAATVVVFELIALAVIRWRFFGTGFVRSLLAVSAGGAVIAVVGALIGSVG